MLKASVHLVCGGHHQGLLFEKTFSHRPFFTPASCRSFRYRTIVVIACLWNKCRPTDWWCSIKAGTLSCVFSDNTPLRSALDLSTFTTAPVYSNVSRTHLSLWNVPWARVFLDRFHKPAISQAWKTWSPNIRRPYLSRGETETICCYWSAGEEQSDVGGVGREHWHWVVSTREQRSNASILPESHRSLATPFVFGPHSCHADA